ncbi:hypothetical protein [Streptomyces sp. NRRL S-813]|uniref:hypothetical protein n=1 Tax=Streptomyces sp. NRRL S-813 TaxID=1463919 RepID=UPI0004BE4906|nr:hypothetical protein [Streptomyces sp. NRRL S-813]
MQTITERFGKKRLTIFFVCCFLVIGAVGIIKSVASGDGPPACAKQWAGVSGVSNADANKMVECDDEVDKWCAKHHPEDPDGCSNNIAIDGDARNVGKD